MAIGGPWSDGAFQRYQRNNPGIISGGPVYGKPSAGYMNPGGAVGGNGVPNLFQQQAQAAADARRQQYEYESNLRSAERQASQQERQADREFQRELATDYNNRLAQANAANEQRYGQILGGYDDVEKRTLAEVGNLGQDRNRQIGEEFGNASGDLDASMISRGLFNTTVRDNMQSGLRDREQVARNALAEQVGAQKAGYIERLGTGKLGVMERRTDAAPSQPAFLGAAGAGGYGSAGNPIAARPAVLPVQRAVAY